MRLTIITRKREEPAEDSREVARRERRAARRWGHMQGDRFRRAEKKYDANGGRKSA